MAICFVWYDHNILWMSEFEPYLNNSRLSAPQAFFTHI